jgi:2-isopropylmalate synthase
MERIISGRGNGPIDAFVDALCRHCQIDMQVIDYREHAAGSGASAMAVAYVEIGTGEGTSVFGVGHHANIVTASLHAVISALNWAARSPEAITATSDIEPFLKVGVSS